MGAIIKCLETLPIVRNITQALLAMPYKPSKIGMWTAATVAIGGFAISTQQGRRVMHSVYRISMGKDVEKLPEQKKKKPTLIVDLEDLFFVKEWSWRDLGYHYTIREHSEVFLFHASNFYEVIGVSSLPPEIINSLLKEIDPYGSISYRIYLPNKEMKITEQINRDPNFSIRVKSGHLTSESDISLRKWKGDKEDVLLDLLDFVINLQEVESSSFQKVLKTYKEKEFHSAYKEVQSSLYPGKRSFLIFPPSEAPINQIHRTRIAEYARAKEYIENAMKLQREVIE
ncbi:mitochondrial import inner membrane translocase subunit TIM50 [Nematocida sp. LUAm3]|nr:mitochondrial import inner membrane translocase subunit TIM50 [Nematocida sp. LUAm3]KAI5176389.1 mitochondrial import inner membrane translocase subunit TIM50 [Nematocida sp. LUAm2]KAI5179049.1 mitochondrial import inner membrane translocase subunit TIM50 [Nematocida sp. LUAm1]